MATSSSQSAKTLIEFMMLVGRLKGIKRTGWVRRDVKDPESVASHMYRMAIMSFLADSETGLCKDRCIKMALVHDLAECIVGDITPADGVSKEEKHRRELAAMEKITSMVGPETSSEIFGLWTEYEEQATNEAKFVKDVDRFDMILQAYEYETADGRPKALQEFFDSTSGFFRHPKVQEWAKTLNEMRDKDNEPSS